MALRVSEHVADPRHAGAVTGADLVGEARGGDRLIVRVGVWLDARGAVVRARFQTTTCASLIAYADAACALAEQGLALRALDAHRIRRSVSDVHPVHHDRADLVARAVAHALRTRRTGTAVAATAHVPGATP